MSSLVVGYLLFVLILHQPIVATPGFWSGDEWATYDSIQARGLAGYFTDRLSAGTGADLGVPVSPVGFAQQGLMAPFMTVAPSIPHLFDVLMHGAIGLLLAYGLHRLGGSFWLTALSAILFAVSPLAAPSTGWVAGSYDRWATLFVLLAVGLTLLQSRPRRPEVLAMATVATLGILSKLTAVIMPLGVALAVAGKSLLLGKRVSIRRYRYLVVAAVAPVAVFLVIRLPAIVGTASGDGGAYSTSLEHLAQNALVAVAYPFVPLAVEPMSVGKFGGVPVAIAAILHALLLLRIVGLFGIRAGAFYAAAYFVYLAPVIMLPTLGGQYFYGSSVALSVALAACLLRALADRQRQIAAFVLILIALTVAHQAVIQLSVYQTGACQTRFYRSLDAALTVVRTEPRAPVLVRYAPGAPDHIARRALHRPKYQALRVTVTNGPVGPLVMQPDCSVAVKA